MSRSLVGNGKLLTMGESKRTMLVLAHTGRENALSSARQAINQLTAAGVAVRVTEEEAAALACSGADVLPAGPAAAEGAELVIVLGGDGSLLRAAELARPTGTPLIGVNLGHVGFLAEAEPDGLTETVDRLVAGDFMSGLPDNRRPRHGDPSSPRRIRNGSLVTIPITSAANR